MGTVKSCIYLRVKTDRCDTNSTADPSGVKPLTRSAPGCQVNRVGTPPPEGMM